MMMIIMMGMMKMVVMQMMQMLVMLMIMTTMISKPLGSQRRGPENFGASSRWFLLASSVFCASVTLDEQRWRRRAPLLVARRSRVYPS